MVHGVVVAAVDTASVWTGAQRVHDPVLALVERQRMDREAIRILAEPRQIDARRVVRAGPFDRATVGAAIGDRNVDGIAHKARQRTV